MKVHSQVNNQSRLYVYFVTTKNWYCSIQFVKSVILTENEPYLKLKHRMVENKSKSGTRK